MGDRMRGERRGMVTGARTERRMRCGGEGGGDEKGGVRGRQGDKGGTGEGEEREGKKEEEKMKLKLVTVLYNGKNKYRLNYFLFHSAACGALRLVCQAAAARRCKSMAAQVLSSSVIARVFFQRLLHCAFHRRNYCDGILRPKFITALQQFTGGRWSPPPRVSIVKLPQRGRREVNSQRDFGRISVEGSFRRTLNSQIH